MIELHSLTSWELYTSLRCKRNFFITNVVELKENRISCKISKLYLKDSFPSRKGPHTIEYVTLTFCI